MDYLIVDEENMKVGLTQHPKQGVAISFIKVWRDAYVVEDSGRYIIYLYQGTTLIGKFSFETTSIVYATV